MKSIGNNTKRRYLVLLVFFMFLYIGPVNLLPYDIPPIIPPQLQETASVVATDYDITIAADSDDDWYRTDVGNENHYTTSDEIYVHNETTPTYYEGQFRWQINIPKDATIDTATFTPYETQDSTVRTAQIYRIDESNVGSLEADSSLPAIDESTYVEYSWDASGAEWGDATNIATLIQDQVDLAEWESGFYFGIRMKFIDTATGQHRFEDYQAGTDNHAYLNVTYSETEDSVLVATSGSTNASSPTGDYTDTHTVNGVYFGGTHATEMHVILWVEFSESIANFSYAAYWKSNGDGEIYIYNHTSADWTLFDDSPNGEGSFLAWDNVTVTNEDYFNETTVGLKFYDPYDLSGVEVYVDYFHIKVEYVTPYLIFYSEVIQADGDDDSWNYDGSWTHITTGTEVIVREYEAVGENIGQFRFQLDIPKDAIIYEATITTYEVNDAMYAGAWIWRIDETDVGDLESDVSVPTANKSIAAFHKFDKSTGWTTSDITDLVQAQVNLTGWQYGYHIGLQFNTTTKVVAWNGFEDYQNAATNHAYINVTYMNSTDDTWLSGWVYRQNNVISQTGGAGTDYTLKVNVSLGDGDAFNHTTFVDGKALTDFGDIRFTTANGTLLSYNLSQTINEATTDYFSDAAVDLGFLSINYPCAYYYNGKTYVAFQGDPDPTTDGLEIYIMYYDHTDDEWSGVYYVGHNFCVDDESGDVHGSPAMWIDDLGYINVFYGAHNEPLTYSRSTDPEDITSFEYRASIPTQAKISYPKVLYDAVSNVAHLMYRFQYADGYLSQVYTNSSDYGITWSTPQTLVNFTTYWKWPLADIMDFDADGKTIHFGIRYRNGTVPSQNDEDIYYMCLNVTTGHLYNASGYDLGVLIDETTELPSCQVYESGDDQTFGPAVHIDENKIPYIMFTDENGGTERTLFTFWNGTGWEPLEQVSSPNTVAGGNDFIVHDSTNITAFVSDDQDIQRYTWNGATWTWQEEIYDSSKMLSQTIVPVNYVDELSVFFTDYDVVLDGAHQKMYAWGTSGRLNGTVSKYACFYVEIADDLTESDSIIYVYYGKSGATTTSESLTISETPWVLHDKWGVEEGNYAPMNDQAPTCSNLDDTDNMYAKLRKYNIKTYASDANGFANIQHIELSFYSNDRITKYWTVRYTEDTDTFSEQFDPSNVITLDAGLSFNTSSGDDIDATFYIQVNWNHIDATDVDALCYVVDDDATSDTDWYEIDWDIETRLDYSVAPSVTADDSGTVDRGDLDETFTIGGTVIYYGGTVGLTTALVDVWVSASQYGTNVGPWSDTTLTAGVFSVTCYGDDEVGIDTYTVKVVEVGAGAGGADLYYTTSVTDTYISDRLLVDMQADDETPRSRQEVSFTLTITYAYDSAICTTYTLTVHRNSTAWYAFTGGNVSLFNDTSSDALYNYTGVSITETTHGLTVLVSNTENVIWDSADWELITYATFYFPIGGIDWGMDAFFIFLGLIMIPASTMYLVRGGRKEMSTDKLFFGLILFFMGWALVIGGIMP